MKNLHRYVLGLAEDQLSELGFRNIIITEFGPFFWIECRFPKEDETGDATARAAAALLNGAIGLQSSGLVIERALPVHNRLVILLRIQGLKKQNKSASLETKRAPGRPRKDEIAERIITLRKKRISWGKLTITLNKETGESWSIERYRSLFRSRKRSADQM